MENKKIQFKTIFGMITAEIGGDIGYPEMFIYLEKPSGEQIDLAAVSVDNFAEEIGVYLYGNTYIDDWTEKHIFHKYEL